MMDRTTLVVFLQGVVTCSITYAYTSTYCEKHDGTDLQVYCNYGCCGNLSLTTPCCGENDKSSSSMPPFSIFFYALTIFILFLVIVCCVGRVARLKNRQPSATMAGRRSSGRHGSQRIPSDLRQTLVLATIENLMRISRQSSASNQNTEEPNHPITAVPLSPPSYDDAIKTPPPELPPSYSEVVNENAVSSLPLSDQRYI